MITFAYPYLWSLVGLPFVFYWIMPAVRGLYGDALKIPFLADLKRISAAGGIWNLSMPKEGVSRKFWFLYLVWILLCAALARPQLVGEPFRLHNESRDIMLVLDISTSMLEPDFALSGRRITRLDAVKSVVSDFASKRANDRLGLILFGTRAYLQAPLTFDKAGVKDILWSMKAGMAGDSTSIGDALALALKTLRNAPDAKNKVIVLLTDGENNDGSLSLGQAIKMAADEDIKVYTIGVGAPNSFFKMLSLGGSGIDEQGLNLLAQVTKGRYFRAENTGDLQKIYGLINTLETVSIDERYIQETEELYYVPLLLAVGLVLAFGLLLRRRQK